LPLAQAKGRPWFVGELAYWLARAGGDPGPAGEAAEPWALQRAGHWREAAVAWAAPGLPLPTSTCPGRGGDEEAWRDVRGSTRAHPAGLTGAEHKVSVLMAQGLRNAEIAARIHRSVRTVDHHVAAVLAKLAMDSRLAAKQRAICEGWLAVPINADGRKAMDGVIANNAELGVSWVHSYVNPERTQTFCIYDAPGPESIRKVADRNGLPVGRITRVSVLDLYAYGA